MQYYFYEDGFLVEGLNEIPAGAIAVSETEYSNLRDAQERGATILVSDKGKPIIAWPEPPTFSEIRTVDIITSLGEIDAATVRPLRALLAQMGTEDDKKRLAELETEAARLRAELAEIEKDEAP